MWKDKVIRWQRLDNAAKIFPALVTREDSEVFRITCQLNENVNPDILQLAVEDALEEFPMFKCVLRDGFFWNYLENTNRKAKVHEETATPFQPLYDKEQDKNRPNLLFDVLYYKERIHLEVFHALTDGTGALLFLRTIVAHYLMRAHSEITIASLDLGSDGTVRQQEADSFNQYFTPTGSRWRIQAVLGKGKKKVYHLHEHKSPDLRQLITEGWASTAAIKKAAGEYAVTITVFLTAVLVASIYDTMDPRDQKKPVSIAVPVNLRNYFPSDTVRNFFGMIDIFYDFTKSGTEFENICAGVAAAFRNQLTKENLLEIIDRQVGLEKNFFVRIAPLAIKNIVMSRSQKRTLKHRTICLSNIGRIDMPAPIAPLIKRFMIANSTPFKQVCLCSYGDEMTIAFSGVMAGREVERAFFRRIAAVDPSLTIAASYTPKSLHGFEE
ncbi:MAG: hypothetical protein E7658_01920 [Ruminococcaceae bacterium]|nr:hypothetical protein [Oscillospiraceae bacterium]